MHERTPADWQLPPGVNRGLWDYVHDPGVAHNYDASLAGSRLFETDQAFVDRYCPSNGHLLDLGCGTGRLLVAQGRRGCRVMGVDLSLPMLQEARAKAAAAGMQASLVQANIVDLTCLRAELFDCVACLFSTLGMVQGADERRRVVAHVRRVLRPGGRFVLHVHNRWFNAWNAQGRRWLLRDWLHGWTGTPTGDRVMPVHQGVAGLTLHLFTRREVICLIREAGLRIVEIRPLSLHHDSRLHFPAWFGWLRAYGYLAAAEKPVEE
jgi:SAM-dependent methyltransferase